MSKDSLGDRMKGYENVWSQKLVRRMPVIVRIDGKAFHTYTKPLKEPFHQEMHECMAETMRALCNGMQGAVLGYTQSDEISILLNDWNTLETCAWFDNKQSKIESVSASIATYAFNVEAIKSLPEECSSKPALFDARAFNVPKEDVVNYFLWRQQDASRNSVQMLGRSYCSHKELHCKNNSEIQDMLIEHHGVNWNDLDTWKRRGMCYVKKTCPSTDSEDTVYMESDYEIPIFTQDRDYIERLL